MEAAEKGSLGKVRQLVETNGEDIKGGLFSSLWSSIRQRGTFKTTSLSMGGTLLIFQGSFVFYSTLSFVHSMPFVLYVFTTKLLPGCLYSGQPNLQNFFQCNLFYEHDLIFSAKIMSLQQ